MRGGVPCQAMGRQGPANRKAGTMEPRTSKLLAVMIVAGGLLTLFSFAMHLEGGRFGDKMKSLIGMKQGVTTAREAGTRR